MAIAIFAVVLTAGCDEAPDRRAPEDARKRVRERANDGKRVALEGYLSLPSSFTRGVSSESAPMVIRGGTPPTRPALDRLGRKLAGRNRGWGRI